MTSNGLRESRKRIFLVDDHPLVREWLEIFGMLGRGFETRRVAEELHISMKMARIKESCSLNSATELLREAVLWDQRDKATG